MPFNVLEDDSGRSPSLLDVLQAVQLFTYVLLKKKLKSNLIKEGNGISIQSHSQYHLCALLVDEVIFLASTSQLTALIELEMLTEGDLEVISCRTSDAAMKMES